MRVDEDGHHAGIRFDEKGRPLKTKDREKIFNTALKSVRKEAGLQTKMGYYFKKYKEYFIVVQPGLNGLHTAEYKTFCKPYFVDDVFWTVFGTEENRQEPMSLRATGAYTIRPYRVQTTEIRYEDPETLEREAKRALIEQTQHAEAFVDRFSSVDAWIQYTKEHPQPVYDAALVEMLRLVQLGNCARAKAIAQTELAAGRTGSFGTFVGDRTKSIYESIVDYCRQRERE